MTKLAGSLVAW